MGIYYTAYCYNPNVGFDFQKSTNVIPFGLLPDNNWNAWNNFDGSSLPAGTHLSNLLYDFDRTDWRKFDVSEFEESGRTKAMGFTLLPKTNEGGFYLGMNIDVYSWVDTMPDVAVGEDISCSIYVRNDDKAGKTHTFSLRWIEGDTPEKFGNNAESGALDSMAIPADGKFYRLKGTFKAKYKHGGYQSDGFKTTIGMRVYQAKLSAGDDNSAMSIVMPMVNKGTEATPFNMPERLANVPDSESKLDPYRLPWRGVSSTDSDNYEDYTWSMEGKNVINDKLNYEGVTKPEIAHIYERDKAQRAIIGINEDTWNNENGRTVSYNVINRKINLVGHTIQIERKGETASIHDENSGSWVDTGDLLYSSQNGLLIDSGLGDMSNSLDDGSFYAKEGQLLRVDEALNSAMYSYPTSLPAFYANEDMAKESSAYRLTTDGIKVHHTTPPDASNGINSLLAELFQYGVATYPNKINKYTTNTKSIKGVWGWTRNNARGQWYAHNGWDIFDWFREGNLGDIKPQAQRLVFVNLATKKVWWFDWLDGLWKKSGEKTMPTTRPTILSSYYALGLPKDGKTKGQIIFTDKAYGDFGSQISSKSLGEESLFPAETKEKVYYAPFWHDWRYNSYDFWWGYAETWNNGTPKYNNPKYGSFGVKNVDYFAGLCDMERIWLS